MRIPLLLASLLLLPACGGGGSSSAPAPAPTPLPDPAFGARSSAGTLQETSITEASGIAASRKNPGVLWVHNDSGDVNRVFALTPAGTHLGIYTITGAGAVDWEDLAIGPGPAAGTDYLYVGDIGDNAAARAGITIWRVPEPAVSAVQAPVSTSLAGAEALACTYPGGARNAETLMCDAQTGDLYIVTKDPLGNSELYRFPYPQSTSSSTALELAGSFALGTAALPGSLLATGGDLSADGTLVALRTYDHVFAWVRQPGQSVASAMSAAPGASLAHAEPQGEAVTFAADASGLYTVSEGVGATIWWVPRTS